MTGDRNKICMLRIGGGRGTRSVVARFVPSAVHRTEHLHVIMPAKAPQWEMAPSPVFLVVDDTSECRRAHARDLNLDLGNGGPSGFDEGLTPLIENADAVAIHFGPSRHAAMKLLWLLTSSDGHCVFIETTKEHSAAWTEAVTAARGGNSGLILTGPADAFAGQLGDAA